MADSASPDDRVEASSLRSSALDALRPRREHVLRFLAVGYLLGYVGVVWVDEWIPVAVTERTTLAATPPLAYIAAAAVVAVAPGRVPSSSRSRARLALAFCGLTVVAFEALRNGWGPSFRALLVPIAVLGWPAAALFRVGILFTWSGPLPTSGGLLLFAIGAAGTGAWQFWLAGWVSRRIGRR